MVLITLKSQAFVLHEGVHHLDVGHRVALPCVGAEQAQAYEYVVDSSELNKTSEEFVCNIGLRRAADLTPGFVLRHIGM